MQLINKFNKGFKFLLCVMDVYSKYAWVNTLKDKKGITITNYFQKKPYINQIANQIKHGLIKVVNFTIVQ